MALQFLPLKHKVRREDRERKADPHNGFVHIGVEALPSGHAADHSYLKKDQCDRKAASHPLPVLLNLTFENEDHRNPGSNHPQRGVHRAGNTERSGIAHALLEVLDVKAEWRGHEYTCDIDSADYTMELRGIVVSDPIGALAHLQLGRAYALSGDKTKAKSAYQDFLTLWKDTDPDIPILKQAKAEYAKLQ